MLHPATRLLHLVILLSLLMTLLGQSVFAQTPPSLPAKFYGSVKINGSYAPVGTTVTALHGGKVITANTFSDSGKTNYVLTVENGTPDGTVTFRVGDIDASQTTTWQAGAITELNLEVTQNQPPTPADKVTVTIPTGLFGDVGGTVQIPLLVSETTGKKILSYQTTITYNAEVLQPNAVITAGTLSQGWATDWNTPKAGELRVAAYAAQDLTGSGTLAFLSFLVKDSSILTSALAFSSFEFNEGQPGAQISHGSFTKKLRVEGTVFYADSTTAVPGINLAVNGPITSTAPGNPNGTYAVYIGATGFYTVTPQKVGDPKSAISAVDGTFIVQHFTGKRTLTPRQLKAADTNSSGDVKVYDAALIARHLAQVKDAEAQVGKWIFDPESRPYDKLTANKANENYAAILIGDVTGDWATIQSRAASADSRAVGLPAIEARPGQQISLPLSFAPFDGYTLEGIQMEIRFDASVLAFHSLSQTGSLDENWLFVHNLPEAGKLLLVGYGAEAIREAGALANLNFDVLGQNGDRSSLTFHYLRFNEENPESAPRSASNGEVVVKNQWQMFLPNVGR